MSSGGSGSHKRVTNFKFVRQIVSMVQFKLVLGSEKESCSFECPRMANNDNDTRAKKIDPNISFYKGDPP